MQTSRAAGSAASSTQVPPTVRGQASRERIVHAAAMLMIERGVSATSIEATLERAGASKSQLYHYFDDKHGLVEAVIAHATAMVFDAQQPHLVAFDGWTAIEAWADQIVAMHDEHGTELGCPLGTLAAELVATDDRARTLLAASFSDWERHVRDGLATMQARGEIDVSADVDDLAVAVMASLQGGLLLSKVNRSVRPLRLALDAAIAHLRARATG